jgi:hypothetical protein
MTSFPIPIEVVDNESSHNEPLLIAVGLVVAVGRIDESRVGEREKVGAADGITEGCGLGSGDSVGKFEGPVGMGEEVEIPKVGLGVGDRGNVGVVDGVGEG